LGLYSTSFGEFVDRALTAAGWSEREVARRSKGAISHATVREMRKGWVPRVEFIVALALALDRNPNEFLDAAGKHNFRYVGSSPTQID
jgi:transcriptional regulator with XRE-family HTH domain